MAFRSIAQMQKFEQLVKEGKMSKQVFDTWMHGTIVSALPQRITPKSPENPEHVHLEHRHKRKQRKQRTRRTMPKQRTQRKKPTQRKLPKKRTMPI